MSSQRSCAARDDRDRGSRRSRVTTYLTIVHYAGITVLCTTTATIPARPVQTSVYSHSSGIPVALLGLIGYVAILARPARAR